MPAVDAKTIGTILAALALAFGQYSGMHKESSDRQEVALGTIQFVNGELAERDAQIADLKAQIEELKKGRKR